MLLETSKDLRKTRLCGHYGITFSLTVIEEHCRHWGIESRVIFLRQEFSTSIRACSSRKQFLLVNFLKILNKRTAME
jgi:hypothetical protein